MGAMGKIKPEVAQEFAPKVEQLKQEFPIAAVDGLGV
jgi:hypothetical protein